MTSSVPPFINRIAAIVLVWLVAGAGCSVTEPTLGREKRRAASAVVYVQETSPQFQVFGYVSTPALFISPDLLSSVVLTSSSVLLSYLRSRSRSESETMLRLMDVLPPADRLELSLVNTTNAQFGTEIPIEVVHGVGEREHPETIAKRLSKLSDASAIVVVQLDYGFNKQLTEMRVDVEQSMFHNCSAGGNECVRIGPDRRFTFLGKQYPLPEVSAAQIDSSFFEAKKTELAALLSTARVQADNSADQAKNTNAYDRYVENLSDPEFQSAATAVASVWTEARVRSELDLALSQLAIAMAFDWTQTDMGVAARPQTHILSWYNRQGIRASRPAKLIHAEGERSIYVLRNGDIMSMPFPPAPAKD